MSGDRETTTRHAGGDVSAENPAPRTARDTSFWFALAPLVVAFVVVAFCGLVVIVVTRPTAEDRAITAATDTLIAQARLQGQLDVLHALIADTAVFGTRYRVLTGEKCQ